jgi:hypothetical protein
MQATVVPQLPYPEATTLKWDFLEKMPPRTTPESAREMWNRSSVPSLKFAKQKHSHPERGLARFLAPNVAEGPAFSPLDSSMNL